MGITEIYITTAAWDVSAIRTWTGYVNVLDLMKFRKMFFNIILLYSILVSVFILMITFESFIVKKLFQIRFLNKRDVILFGIVSGFIVGNLIILYFTNNGSLLFIHEDNDSKLLLSTSATIIGTILAVSFSILILGIQHALGSYAPSLVKHFAMDRPTLLCFGILSFSTIFCLYGIVLPNSNAILNLSLFMSPYCFGILIYFYYIRSTTTTLSLFDRLKNKTRNYLRKKLGRKLENQAKLSLKDPMFQTGLLRFGKDIKTGLVAAMVMNNLFHDGTVLEPVKQSINDIMGLIHRRLHSNDDESVQYGLDAISLIVQDYIDIRRDSPEDKLIQSVYEQIVFVTASCIDKKNTYLISKIVETYAKIGVSATQIDSFNGILNQSAGLSVYYLNQIFYQVGVHSNIRLEVIRSIRKITIYSITRGGTDLLSLNNYSQMVKNSKSDVFYLIYREIIGATAEIVACNINAKVNEITIKMQLELLDEMSSQIIKRLSQDQAHYALLPIIDNSAGFQFNFHTLVLNLIKLKDYEDEDLAKRALEKHAFESVPHLLLSLMRICFVAAGRKYYMIINYSLFTLYDIVITLIEENYLLILTFHEDVRNILEEMHSLFVSYFDDDERIGGALFNTFNDVFTTLGLKFVELGKTDLAESVLESYLKICFHSAKIDKYGYDTARMTKGIVMIGVFASERNSSAIEKKAIETLNAYDSKINEISIEPQQRPTIDDVRREMDEYDVMLDISIKSPRKYLHENLSNSSWSKFKKSYESFRK